MFGAFSLAYTRLTDPRRSRGIFLAPPAKPEDWADGHYIDR